MFSVLILLSGIHLTVASHLCGGELAAVKCSITGEMASCGMQESQMPVSGSGSIESDCCKNSVSVCRTDGNYLSSFQHLKAVPSAKAPLLQVAISHQKTEVIFSETYHSMVGPPVTTGYNSVDQSFICVFII